ncbi:2-oxo acid dehydrogenase subunit E2 [Cryobacterium sp. Sr8]|uniref:dihydrolipoamide acetyltransferase family protein n=1 Tax=Cryobacterium sp. Sr8 TaxID=1259203 RepID=UPI00106A18A6|nr:dihydrolipoamide acetyltransferase family protein [Cryobacterium sp. Sr8]TFD82098.1 2-oxo acid dehydrogenase subunit E2 [Cryobacterium sp. Sr8]
MIKVFKLPDLGEGLTESEIVAWHIAPGDTVTLNQHIADVETAKAVVELPSPFAGTVSTLHQPTGVVVQVGEAIVSFDVEGAEPAAAAPTAGTDVAAGVAAPAEPAQEREAVLVGYGASVERGGRPQRRARRGAAPAPAAAIVVPAAASVRASVPGSVPASVPAGVVAVGAERPRSTPPVRALARDLGIDLARLTGTGPDGLITRDDVRAGALTGPGADATVPTIGAAASVPGARESRTPIKSVRKHTAAAMVRSAFTAPHVTEFLTVDVTPTMELLDSLKRNRAFADQRINILTVVAKALCIAASRHPSVNTRWDDEAGEIVQYHYVNLGIAAATPRGLLVPNITDADALGLTGLSAALAALTDAARAGTTSPAALSGGTITITNIGVFGIDAGTPILNPGEAAILAMGAIRRTPWEYKGEIALRQVMTLSLSFDHRLVDGEQGSRFLADIGAILAEPGMVLTMV